MENYKANNRMENKRLFCCNYCSSQFSSRQSLHRHKKFCNKRSIQNSNYSCSLKCRKTYRRNDNFSFHMKVCKNILLSKRKEILQKNEHVNNTNVTKHQGGTLLYNMMDPLTNVDASVCTLPAVQNNIVLMDTESQNVKRDDCIQNPRQLQCINNLSDTVSTLISLHDNDGFYNFLHSMLKQVDEIKRDRIKVELINIASSRIKDILETEKVQPNKLHC